MATEIRVPTLGESVSEATIGKWFKKPGDAIKADEPLVELETDKVTLEVNAPAAGVLGEIVAKEGETVGVNALLGSITAGLAAEAAKPAAAAPAASGAATKAADSGPAVARLAAESGVDPSSVAASGKDGRVTKGDMLAAIATAPAAAAAPAPVAQVRAPSAPDDASREERVKMTKLRQTIARRLQEAQNTAAMLTTFNEVDMSAVMALRNQYKDVFEKKHGVKLGFMGFFTKAVIQALKEIPAVNAEIDGTDIIYKNYAHIGVAVGTDKGLVVPVVRDADRLTFLGDDLAKHAGGRRVDLERHLVGFELDQGLVGLHRIAGLLEPLADGRLGNGLAEGGYADFGRHVRPLLNVFVSNPMPRTGQALGRLGLRR